ncbi:hypothetical protein EJB05_34237, partial [Eragrostis curvula]
GAGVPAAWNYGAVERALREASGRGAGNIFQPVVGKVFDSTEEAFEFINMYSWEVGFGIRFGWSRSNKSGRRTMQDIICACEGRVPRDGTRSIRCGCSAMVRLLRQEDDTWFISRFVLEHTHPLSRGCGERRQWKSHSRIDKMTRDLVRHLRDNNVQISRESIEGDMAKTLEIFENMKSSDPSMALRLDLDGGGRVRLVPSDAFRNSQRAATYETQYNRLISDRAADEGKEEHATKQVCRIMKVGVPIEHHAARVYTRRMFEKFGAELFRSGSFKCHAIDSNGSYKVSLINREGCGPNATCDFLVHREAGGAMLCCECKMFEHVGMPCRHIISVLVSDGASEIPSGLVLKRWSRDAKIGLQERNAADSKQLEADPASLHHVMYAAAMELVGMSGSSRQAFDVGLSFVSRAKEAISSMTVVGGADPVDCGEMARETASEAAVTEASGVTSVTAPPRVHSRGRPKEKRFKSPIESPGARKKKRIAKDGLEGSREPNRGKQSKPVDAGSKLVGSPSRKASIRCRSCGESGHYSWNCPGVNEEAGREPKGRRCKLCGEMGHYKSTCGRKSSYK